MRKINKGQVVPVPLLASVMLLMLRRLIIHNKQLSIGLYQDPFEAYLI